MIAIPAIGLRGGACVSLCAGGDSAGMEDADARAVADDLARLGFQRLHVVDLDARFGVPGNDEAIRALLRESPLLMQVAGGVRTPERVDELLGAGADWVVVSARVAEDGDWLADVSPRHPHQVFVRIGVQGRRLASRPRSRTLPPTVLDFVETLAPWPIAGIVLQVPPRDGASNTIDLGLLEDVVDAVRYPVCLGGGTPSIADLRAAADRGAAAALIERPFDAAIDARFLTQEFGE